MTHRYFIICFAFALLLAKAEFATDKLPSSWKVEKVEYRDDGRLAMVQGDLTPAGQFNNPSDLGWAFVEQYANQFGITAPREELTLTFALDHKLWFTQIYKGVPISFPPALVLHLDHSRVTQVENDFYPGLDLDVTPQIDSVAAKGFAAGSAYWNVRLDPWEHTNLVIFPGRNGCRLAWEIWKGARFYVDAKTGEILKVFTGEM